MDLSLRSFITASVYTCVYSSGLEVIGLKILVKKWLWVPCIFSPFYPECSIQVSLYAAELEYLFWIIKVYLTIIWPVNFGASKTISFCLSPPTDLPHSPPPHRYCVLFRGGKNVLLHLYTCAVVGYMANSLFWVVFVVEMMHRCEQPSPVTMETGDETAGSWFLAYQEEVEWSKDPTFQGLQVTLT